jgi:hypothetical protein
VQRFQPRCAAAPWRRRSRERAAEDRAGYARAGRHGSRSAHVPAGVRRRCAVRVRRLDAFATPFRRGHRRGRGRLGTEPARARLDLHGRRLGRAVGACARQGSQVQRTAPHARPRRRVRQDLYRGRKPDVAPVGRRARRTARRGQGHGVPRDRLRAPGREPLHQPPLLGGRSARHEHAHRLDGALPRPARCRRTQQSAAGALPGLLARACACHRDDARSGGLLAGRLHDVGRGTRR